MPLSERKIPMSRTETSLVDPDFSATRARFEAEMRKMEEEMNRFRSSLGDSEREFFNSSRAINTLDENFNQRKEVSEFLENSPLVQDTEHGKALVLKFDVTQYAPEEIVVKTVDNRLQVGMPELIFSFLTI